METVVYPTRKDLVAALRDARSRGVQVEVVGNGRTLKFPDGIGATPEDEVDESLLGVVTPSEPTLTAVPDDFIKPPAPEQDRSNFTVEGTCSECHEPALAEPDGTWVHAGPSSHGDTEGEFVPAEPVVEEDIIGVPPTPTPPAKSSKRTKSKGQ